MLRRSFHPELPAGSVVGQHVVERVAQFVSTLFDLELLAVDLVLYIVDPLIELGYIHLPILVPSQQSMGSSIGFNWKNVYV
jgi:hypothetical protein